MRLLLLWCVWLLTGLGVGQAACLVQPRAEIGLDVVGGTILLPLQVNGITAHFILDTGAERSLVTTGSVPRLDLALDAWVGTTMRGVGGVERHPNANPRSLILGGIALQRRTLNRDTSLTVGTMPRTEAEGRHIDGLLGRDFLAAFDLVIDLPTRLLTLYDVQGCSGRFLPWSRSYTSVPVQNPAENALVVPVMLDGMPMRALLDTGASASLVGLPGMVRLGLSTNRLATDPSASISGQGPRLTVLHRHRFVAMQVGNETIKQPVYWVGPIRFTPIVDMLLGADWLAGKRVWISYATRQLFVATP